MIQPKTMTNEDLLKGFLTNNTQEIYKPITISDNYMSADVQGLFNEIQGMKLMTMQELIKDIEDQIEERKKLQEEVFKDADKTLMEINNFLRTAGERIDTVEELRLREKLTAIQEFKMQEKINMFRDIALLKKEMRDRIQALKEKEQNTRMIEEIINE